MNTIKKEIHRFYSELRSFMDEEVNSDSLDRLRGIVYEANKKGLPVNEVEDKEHEQHIIAFEMDGEVWIIIFNLKSKMFLIYKPAIMIAEE